MEEPTATVPRAGEGSEGRSPRQAVLVLTQPFDLTVDPVIEKFHERGVEFVRFDTGWFPKDATLVSHIDSDAVNWRGSITSKQGRSVDLSRIGSVWFRRPRDFSFDDDLDEGALKFARGEALQSLGGVLRALDCRWVSHPEKIVAAEYKPHQLAVAARLGWTLPRTLITNDPEEARRFVKENEADGVVYKPLSGTRGQVVDGELSVIYTRPVTAGDPSVFEAVRYTPCLLQARVRRGFDLRITVVGDEVFPAAIRNSDPDEVDWRRQYENLSYSVYPLPVRVQSRCVDLVRSLGLNFGAIDVICSADGDYVFLEINPNGQWAWLEEQTGLPIAAALADCLAPYSATGSR